MRPELMIVVPMIIVLSLAGLTAFADERPGPKGSGGGRTPSAGMGVPQMQTPVDPMKQGGDTKGTPQPGSGKGTQNPKEDSNSKAGSQSTDKTKGQK